MVWFKVDDGLTSNKKVLRIPRSRRMAAVGLWAMVGAWCARELTDGLIPDYLVEEIGGTEQQVDDLVKAGLWEVSADGHFFPNWDEYQPMKEDQEARRNKWREKKRAQRRDSDGKFEGAMSPGDIDRHADVSEGESHRPVPRGVPPSRPVPSRPVLTTNSPSESRPRKRATALVEGWMPSDNTKAAMKAERPDLDFRTEHAKFVDYATANGKTYKDWDAAWRNWMRNARPTLKSTRGRDFNQERTNDYFDQQVARLAAEQAAEAQKEISA